MQIEVLAVNIQETSVVWFPPHPPRTSHELASRILIRQTLTLVIL